MLRWSPICVSVKCATCPSSSQNYMCSFPKPLPWLHGAGHKQNTVYCSFLKGTCGLTDEAKMWAIQWQDSGNWNVDAQTREKYNQQSAAHRGNPALPASMGWRTLSTGACYAWGSPSLRSSGCCVSASFFLVNTNGFKAQQGNPAHHSGYLCEDF